MSSNSTKNSAKIKNPTEGKTITRRGVLKGLAVLGASLTAGAVAGKVASNSISASSVNPEAVSSYNKELLRGDAELIGRGYEEVSKEEKQQMVKYFEDNYRRGS